MYDYYEGNIDDGVERRPSNLDREAKLTYQAQVNSKKKKEKSDSFNSE